MIRFVLGEEFGGVAEFDSPAEAILWVQQQIDRIKTAFGPILAHRSNSGIGVPILAWGEELEGLESRRRQRETSPVEINNPLGRLMTADSDLSQILQHVMHQLDAEGFEGATGALGWNGPLSWQSSSQVAGVVCLNWLRKRFDTQKKSESQHKNLTASEDLEEKIEDLRRSTIEAQVNLVSLVSSFNETKSQIELRFANQESNIETKNAAMKTNISKINSDLNEKKIIITDTLDQFMTEGVEKINAWILSQKEQTRLEAPVNMWEQRSRIHQKRSDTFRVIALGVGIIGLIIAAIISKISYEWARGLFEEAIIRPKNAQIVASGITLSPTFHFQLIFSAAATLLWLTMYIWMMRIIVRRHLSELHLATDASGRAAMTQAYLGLIKEGAATDAERAIVMGAIFQPVTNGNANDDGPPAVSLPSLVAAIVSGKSPA